MPNKIWNVLIHFFLINILYHNSYSYIVIPFKTYHRQITPSQNIAENFIKENINNTIYIELDIGNPSQKIPALIYSDEFGIFLLNKKCPISSSFNNIESSSSTFTKSELYKDYTYKFRTQTDMLLASDIFRFELNDKNQKQAILNFMYSPNLNGGGSIIEENAEKHFADNNNYDYTCLGIGIRSEQYVGRDFESNFVRQLYHKEIIENNYFSIITIKTYQFKRKKFLYFLVVISR